MKIDFLEIFLEYLYVEKNVSKNTLESYKLDILAFLKYLPKKFELNKALLDDYITHLNNQNFKTNTINRKIASLKNYFDFLYNEKIISINPAVNIKSAKKDKILPKVLEINAVFKFLDSLNDLDIYALRLKVLMELMYSTGLRISELLSLPVNAINKNDDGFIIRVLGKGSKERLLPLSNELVPMLQKYLTIRKNFTNDRNNQFLFASNSKQKYLTRQRLTQLIKEHSIKVGLDYTQISAHVFRHSFATHLLQNGADLLSIKKLLGHSDIATTQIYTHVLPKNIMDLITKNHPLSLDKE